MDTPVAGGASRKVEVEEAIQTRRSIRSFDRKKPVEDEHVTALLEAGRWAPSGLNNQPWRVVLVRESLEKARIAECTVYSSVIESSPLLIPVFLDTEASYHREKDIMAIGAFIQNLLLTAHARGLGAVWLGEILKNKERVREILGLHPRYELMAVVAVGYPAEKPRPGERVPLKEIVLETRG